MILIADSGSTKTEWILLDKGEQVVQTETIGLNPFFVTQADVQKAILNSKLAPHLTAVKAIHFFGAGCSNELKLKELESYLSQVFKEAEVEVKTDIEGAVLAVSDNKPCLVCILGTGSTFRIFDGKDIQKKYSSLAYIIGDEGSGTHIAKALLRKVFYKQLPQDLRDDFFREYPIDASDLLQKVYKEPLANRYLASFVPFCKKHIERPEIEQIVLDCLDEFGESHLSRLAEIKDSPVHFIGSIAFYFEDQLKQIAQKHGFKIGKIVQKPLSHLKEQFV
ncbi:MAG: glucosamine kinase [Chitinophagales bacterium]|jgi:N-acetylglucosamine kinase-like BadF-type ATPase